MLQPSPKLLRFGKLVQPRVPRSRALLLKSRGVEHLVNLADFEGDLFSERFEDSQNFAFFLWSFRFLELRQNEVRFVKVEI